MSEKCPLSGFGWSTNIPEVCYEQCEDLWNKAIDEGNIDGDYDTFPQDRPCSTHEAAGLESEDTSLQVTYPRSNVRIVGVTDLCIDCGGEYGAQSFKFACPNE